MRLRRLCEEKASKKCHVPADVAEAYRGGGEEREWMEIALLEVVKAIGTDRKFFKQVKAWIILDSLICFSFFSPM